MNLYPFQEQVVAEMLAFLNGNDSHAVYNACEQGLGKCAMTVRTAESIGATRVVVVCPAVIRLTWKDEVEKWTEPFPVPVSIYPILTGSDVKNLDLSRPGWYILSYSLASDLTTLLAFAEKKWDLLILDEAHYVKSMEARRSRACLVDLWPRCKYRILLSGTPCTTSIVDIYTAASKCAPRHFKDFDTFANRYTYVRIHPRYGARYLGIKRGSELKAKLREHFFIRRTKEEVLPDLPPKTFQKITLPATLSVMPKAKDEADKLQLEVDAVVKLIKTGRMPVPPKNLAEQRRMQGEAKVRSVAEFCENLLDEDLPLVVFGHHRNFIAGLSAELKKYRPLTITGDTKAEDRASAVAAFQGGDANLIIANYVAGGIGITLNRGSICVLGELDWSPATVAQSVDRLHRIGQKNPVMIYYFVVKNSIDEAISRAIISKTKTISEVVNN